MRSTAELVLAGAAGSGRSAYANALCHSLLVAGGAGDAGALEAETGRAVHEAVARLRAGEWAEAPSPSSADNADEAPRVFVYSAGFAKAEGKRGGDAPTATELVDCEADVWGALGAELAWSRDNPGRATLLKRVLAADAILGFLDLTQIRLDPEAVQRSAGEIVSLAETMQTRRARERRRGPLPVALIVSKCDLGNASAANGAVHVLGGARPPRMAGQEDLYQESLVHLAHLRRRLVRATGDVKGFAVSTLEWLRESGTLSHAQAIALDPRFEPNGIGLDLEAPVRWALGKAGLL
ncbi:MAG: hypothetical protein LBT54_02995 [Bifidobacteriaceae bacterium]|jgi:hypothetical protein|nr:hypothetical protein [Bifidobacteriaceae bacterium]